jgi:hypothetical protein
MPAVTNQPEARPCACGHLSNRHNALVSGPCQQLGCDCPDFREPEPEAMFVVSGRPIRRGAHGLDRSPHVVVDREMLERLTEDRRMLAEFRAKLAAALGMTRTVPDAELLSYVRDAIQHAQALPGPVRSGQTVTMADLEIGSPTEDEAAAWAGDSPEWTQ